MTQQKNIPDSQFKDQDVNTLIRQYGVKPPEKLRDQLKTYLEGQKEKFIAFERDREKSRQQSPERGR